MKPILIPKKQHQNDDLVIISRGEYERLFRQIENIQESQLDSDLLKSLKEVKSGQISPAFETADELMVSLQG